MTKNNKAKSKKSFKKFLIPGALGFVLVTAPVNSAQAAEEDNKEVNQPAIEEAAQPEEVPEEKVENTESASVEENDTEKVAEEEEIDDGIAKVEEIQEETVENIQPENTAETIENKVEEKVQLVNIAPAIEEKTQLVNNEANNEIVEEKVQIQNNNTNNKETLTENKDNSLEMSDEKKVDEVKESKEKSTRGIDELNKLDNKNLNKDRLQFLEKLAFQVDNVPYISDPNKNPEIYKESEPDSLTCSEYVSWGLYHTGHTEIGNHYVRDFYSDSKNFTRLTDKDILLPGDLILDYKEGNKAGHILVYAGKDVDGNEIVLHSTRVKGSNPNEQFLQNGPNIIKRSDYKMANSYPILVRYNGFEKTQTQPAEAPADNNYASETNKNIIDNFQVDDIKITRADDPSKESYFESPYNFNISFSNIGKIKEGDSLKLIGYYPKLYNTETKEEYHFGVFPYQSKAYDEKVKQDIKVKYGNKEIVIGQLVGNKIIFNKNVESLDKFNFSVNLGIAAGTRLNVEKEGRKDLYEVPFYLNINGKTLSKPYLQKIRPNTREKLVASNTNYARGRIYTLPTEKNKRVLHLFDNPYGALAKLRDENRWQNDKISVKITLPEGLEFENNQTIRKRILAYYTNNKKIVLADNHDINRHYDQHGGILSSLTTIKDNKTAINNFDITDKPLGKNEGRYDRTNVGALVSIMDSNAIDLKTGKLKNPIKFEYFINGKLVDTQELMDIEMLTTSSSSGGSAEQSHKTTKEEIKAKMLYEADDSLEFGKQVVVKNPVNGEKEITIIKKIVDGKVVEEKSEKVIKQKQDGLTKIGNKKVVEEEIPPIKGGTKPGKKTTTTIYEVDKNTGKLINPKETVKVVYPAEKIQDISKKVTRKDINYNTIYKKDETLKHGEKKIVQKGVKGNKEITQIGSNKPTEKIIKKPIDEIVHIGNKKIVEEEVPAIDGGKPGTKTTTTVWDVDPKTGKLINPKTTIKISYPMENIQDIATKTTKDIADVDFEIIYEADPNLEYGKTQIKQDGKKGKKEITIISKVVDGKRVEEKSEKIIKKPASKIISVGNREVINKEIPYKTIKKETNDLEIGQSKVQTKGITGVETTTKVYEIDKNTGKLINPKESKKITKEKVDEVILIGTKKVIPATEIEDIATKTTKTNETIKAGNKYIADEELEFEKQETDKEAKDGEKEITTTSKVVDGERQETTEEKVIKDAEDGLIRVGNKKVETKKLDPLYEGGESGTETTTTIYEVDENTGKLINPVSTTKKTYPTAKIDDIATKTTTKEESVDFETKYVGNSSLEYGKTEVFQEGKNGTKEVTTISKVVDGKRIEETNEVIKTKPTPKIISVGNKKVEKEDIPFEVVEKETKDLEIGETDVETKGKNGVKTTTTIYEVDPNTGKLINGKETVKETEPVNEIKLIGTKKVIPAEEIEDIAKTTKVTKEVIPAENKYIADEELDFEKQETDKEAKDGEKEITTISQSGKDDDISEKVIREPENGVIRVGNKTVEVKDNDDGSTTTTTTIYEVDPNTGELINPKSTSKTTYPMTEIEDIAKPITKDQGTQTPPETKDESTQTPPETSDKGTQTEDENKDKVPGIVAEKVNKVEKTTQTEPETKEVKEEKVTSNQPVQNTQPANKSTNSQAGKNVKTGVSGIAGIVATLGAAITGLFASKKKED